MPLKPKAKRPEILQPSSATKPKTPRAPRQPVEQPTTSSATMPRPILIPQNLLDDLCGRFIINIPKEERQPIRMFWQIELAHWFYTDEFCPKDPRLPKCHIREFAYAIFNHIPTLQDNVHNFDQLFENWLKYKYCVPTYGLILMDEELEHVLLVQGWGGRSWGFPKGKVNADEDPIACACREAKEETGFDASKLIRSDMWIEQKFGAAAGSVGQTGGHLVRLYIVRGVSRETQFAPLVKCEIKDIKWFPLDILPTTRTDCHPDLNMPAAQFFMTIPFIRPLQEWAASERLKRHKRRGRKKADVANSNQAASAETPAKGPAKEHTKGKKKQSPAKPLPTQTSQTSNISRFSSSHLHNVTIDFKPIWKKALAEMEQSPDTDAFFLEVMREAIN